VSSPTRGEVWLADLEPARGAELNKVRPVVVINVEDVGVLPVRLVAPITAWSPNKMNRVWLVRIRPTRQNGLTKESCVDTMQVRGMSVERLSRRLGELSRDDIDEVATAVAVVVGYPGASD
jgi:mRNA interferase MazF